MQNLVSTILGYIQPLNPIENNNSSNIQVVNNNSSNIPVANNNSSRAPVESNNDTQTTVLTTNQIQIDDSIFQENPNDSNVIRFK